MTATTNPRIEEALKHVDPQVWIVTARADGESGGLVATFVTKASIVPSCPRFLVGLANHHHTRELVERSGHCVLHVIGKEHLPWVLQLGLVSGKQAEGKLSGLATGTLSTGTPVLTDSLAAFDCRVESKMQTGDRTVYLLEVQDAMSRAEDSRDADETPLRFSDLWALLTREQREQMTELFRLDQVTDRQAIINWRADLLEAQS